MKNRFFSWLTQRFAERSTWIGLAGMGTALGIGISPEQTDALATVGIGISSAILTFSKDRNG